MSIPRWYAYVMYGLEELRAYLREPVNQPEDPSEASPPEPAEPDNELATALVSLHQVALAINNDFPIEKDRDEMFDVVCTTVRTPPWTSLCHLMPCGQRTC